MRGAPHIFRVERASFEEEKSRNSKLEANESVEKESSDLSLFIERLKASKKALSNDLRHHTSHINATISSKVSSINWRCEANHH